MNKNKKDIGFKVGDTVSCKYKLAWNSKAFKFAKGFVTKDYVAESMKAGRGGFCTFKNYNLCKTTFSYKSGSGTKNFSKKNLKYCGILLVERFRGR